MKSIQERVETAFLSSLANSPASRSSTFFCAYSGGPDSSVLLYLLNKYQQRFHYSLTAAYVNHNIRSKREMEREVKEVQAWTSGMGIHLKVKTFPPGFISWYSRQTGQSLESAARKCRYHFFAKLAGTVANPCLFLGHNKNDQVETVLMRLFQGSGPDGLTGISQSIGYISRPLLEVSRKDILSYADLMGIPFFTDSTNLTGEYRRNRIRLELVPLLDSIFPGYDQAILQQIEDYAEMAQYVYSRVGWEQKGKEWRIPCELFNSLPYVIRKKLVLDRINTLNKGVLPGDYRISDGFFNPLKGNLPEKNRVFLKGYRVIVENRNSWIVLKEWKEKTAAGTYHLLSLDNPYDTDCFTVRILQADREADGIPWTVKRYMNIRDENDGFVTVFDGAERVLTLDSIGRIVYFSHGNEKKLEKERSDGKDCIIIEVEVKDALG